MSACQLCSVWVCLGSWGLGGESWISKAEPHFLIVQSGASRSVSPEMLRIEWRFLEARNRGSESWYLSAKR